MLERSTVPVALFPLKEAQQGKDYPLLELAKICGVILGKGEERISTHIAGPDLAQDLKCDASDPLLRLDRIVYTITGQPAKWRVGHCKLNGKYYSASIGPES
jgi:DNA-binding GntR family transcriptional regulator